MRGSLLTYTTLEFILRKQVDSQKKQWLRETVTLVFEFMNLGWVPLLLVYLTVTDFAKFLGISGL
jgi:hypothetical protein